MYTIKKILVPTDFSENASKAYNHAQQIASRYRATVDFIHIIPTLQYFGESLEQLGMPLDMENDVYPHAQKRATEKMNELMEKYLKPANRGEDVVKIAPSPSKALSNHAEQGHYDLIVMGARGQHDSDLLRGSITEKLIRYSKVPVLHTDQPAIESIEKILVPTDVSQTSLEALPFALSVALKHGASIILYHALEVHGTQIEDAQKYVHKSEAEDVRDIIYEALDEFLEEYDYIELRKGDEFESQFVVSDGASNATVNVKTVVEKTVSDHTAITNYGNEHTDLTVLATHGRAGLAHMFLGSTAEKVVQHSANPTVTIKPSLAKNRVPA